MPDDEDSTGPEPCEPDNCVGHEHRFSAEPAAAAENTAGWPEQRSTAFPRNRVPARRWRLKRGQV